MLFCQNVYNNGTFSAKFYTCHVLNQDTYVDHFCCLISKKYTAYDNIFLSTRVSNFAIKNFQPNAYQVKFSIELLGKRVRRHINIKSGTLNVQSVRQP